MDQRELVERARRGDHDAFAVLAGASIARLEAVARLILRDVELARDAVQEAYLRAWHDLPGLRDPDRFDAWLHRLTVNACLDDARRRRRRPIEVELTPIEPAATDDMARTLANRDLLERGFERLPLDQRAILVLHYYVGLPVPAVAETLGIPVGTAQSRLGRALAVLRDELASEFELGPHAGPARADRMNQTDRIERELTAWFVETAAPRTPEFLDDLLAQTAGSGQRPAWTFPERWLPDERHHARTTGDAAGPMADGRSARPARPCPGRRSRRVCRQPAEAARPVRGGPQWARGVFEGRGHLHTRSSPRDAPGDRHGRKPRISIPPGRSTGPGSRSTARPVMATPRS